MRAQAAAVEEFAAALRELRKSVGNPPFREMSGRSGAISHTTLYEAAKGNRLPSWGTTVEFVKACGADPAGYRERWERANRVVGSARAGRPEAVAGTSATRPSGGAAATASGPERHAVHIAVDPPSLGEDTIPVGGPPSGEVADGAPPAAPAHRGRFRLTRPVAITLATAVVGLGAVIVVVVAVNRGGGGSKPGGDGLKPAVGASKAALSPADCPVHPTNPPAAPPVHKGDLAVFIADITLPDCTRVGTGKTVAKVWRLKNAGKVPWEGYSLRRLDLPQQADQCQTISDVPIKDTRPGAMVDIRADITTPRKPGLCYVRFKMVDAAGKVAFPGSRPVNFQIIVEAR
ncbi:NBR1-Ig-like domain-containing protein [Actinomadura sp. NAK00032]|uniref:NBR1-Ig-like domain-containing protein n=1 Tax=Actinomadura sp. NAK00032 TaxID=2742128 RepID=UPI0020C76259|nr:NBR1-Ig-like domain-containing protein [Actinomadura sp. NAK00032]